MDKMKPVRRPGFSFPSRLVLLFGLGSGALVLTTLGAFWHEYRAEWRVFQRQAPAGEEKGLRQIWLRDVDVVDRCTSCHLGAEGVWGSPGPSARPASGAGPTPPLAVAGAGGAEDRHPFRAHPSGWLEAHRIDQFACTPCHGGVGEATSRRGVGHPGSRGGVLRMASATTGGASRLASRELMEARCGTCHLERRPRGASILARGRARIAEYGCIACHELPGYDARELRVPRLDGLDRKVSPSWLRRWLARPRDLLPRTRMGDFRLAPQEVESLAAFLLTPRLPPLPSSRDGGDAAKGGELFRKSRCVTCHAVDGRGGTLGPDLASVGAKASAAWLSAWIADPHSLQPSTRMPRFRFSDAEIRDLVAYLRNDLAAEPPGSASNDQPDPALAGEGRALFERRGCGSCHGLTDGPPVARIGPKLTAIGDRVLEPAPLLLRDLEPTLPNWLGLKVREPDAVLDGARMPTFGFDAREAAELAVALSSLRARTMPETRTTKDPPLSFAEPQGEFGSLVRRYRCLSCHTLAGAGGTLSTVALDRIGSQLRREYLEGFLVEPVAVRVGLAERMPKLGLTAGEAKTLAAHMSAVLVDDTLAGDLPADAATLARGKLLLDRLGCIGCHMVGEGGGYVGPELNGSGLRLLPRWTAEFLRDPERWKPGTLQPSYGLSGEEAEALAAYTLSLPARKGRRTP